MAKKWIIGFFILVVLTSSIYVMLPDKVRIDVQKTRTKFSVWENDGWVLSAIEYARLWDGSKLMRAKSRELMQEVDDGIITITRTSEWKENITTIHTCTFDSSTSDVELIPVDEEFTCINCEGKIVSFEYRDILYDGETKQISSPFSFGHNMKLEWEDGAYYAKVFQQKIASDKIIVKYRPDSDYVSYKVRLFDPAGPFWVYNIENVTLNEGFGTYTFLTNLSDYANDTDTDDKIWYTIEYEDASKVDCNLTLTEWDLKHQTSYDVDWSPGVINRWAIVNGVWETSYASCTTRTDGWWNITLNYTIPFGVNKSGSYWQVSDSPSYSITLTNLTISDDCWSDPLELKVGQETDGNVRWYCKNQSSGDYNLLRTASTNVRACEEGMYWDRNAYQLDLISQDWRGVTNCTVGINDSTSIGGNKTFFITVDNVAPTIVSSRISPLTPGLEDNLDGYCNATDAVDNVTYYWIWFRDDIEYSSSTSSNYTSGIEVNVDTISSNCYQETANISTACGGLDTGNYAWVNITDNRLFYVNYSVPINATSESFWEVKHGTTSSYNVTIPDECWKDPLEFKMKSTIFFNVYTASLQCYNITGTWKGIGTGTTGSGASSYTGIDANSYLMDGDWSTGAALHGGVNTFDECTGGACAHGVIYEEAMNWVIDSAGTSGEEEWILSCLSSDDSYNSSWLNSSTVTILVPPNTTLYNPVNGTVALYNPQTVFNFSTIPYKGDITRLDKCELWGNWSGSFSLKDTITQVPDDPTIIGNFSNATSMNYTYGIAIDGDYAYAAGYYGLGNNGFAGSIAVIDIHNRSAPVQVGAIHSGSAAGSGNPCIGWPYGLHISDNFLYVASEAGGRLGIVNVTDPTNPVYTGCYENGSYMRTAEAVKVVDDIAYVVAWTNSSLTILNVTDKSNPVGLGWFQNETSMGGAIAIEVSGNYAYVVGANSDTLAIIDVSDPTTPVQVGSFKNTTSMSGPYDLAISGDYAYIAPRYSSYIPIINISDPTNPYQVGSVYNVTSLYNANHIDVYGNYAYVANIGADREGIIILDVTDPTNPFQLITLFNSDYMLSASFLEFYEGYVYVTARDLDSLVIIDPWKIKNDTITNFDARFVPYGTNHLWNVKCYDNNGDNSFATDNYSLDIINDPPTWLYNISDTSTYYQTNTTYISNLSDYVNDTDGGDDVTISVQDENASEVDCELVGNYSEGYSLNLISATGWLGTASCTLGIYDGTEYGENDTFLITVIVGNTSEAYITLDGLHDNRSYELGTTANLSFVSEHSTLPVTFDVYMPGKGLNYSTGTASSTNNVSIGILLTDFQNIYKFINDASSYLLTFRRVAYDLFYVTLPSYLDLVTATVDIAGVLSDDELTGWDDMYEDDVISKEYDSTQTVVYNVTVRDNMHFSKFSFNIKSTDAYNVSIDIGNNGTIDYSLVNFFTATTNILLDSDDIDAWVDTQTADADGMILIPFNISFSTDGNVTFSGFDIEMDDQTYPAGLVIDTGNDGNVDINLTSTISGDSGTISTFSDGTSSASDTSGGTGESSFLVNVEVPSFVTFTAFRLGIAGSSSNDSFNEDFSDTTYVNSSTTCYRESNWDQYMSSLTGSSAASCWVYSETIPEYSADNITALTLTVTDTEVSGVTATNIYISANNGTNWTLANEDGTSTTLDVAGQDILWKAQLQTDGLTYAYLQNILIEGLATTPSNVTVDVGNTGESDYNITGNLDSTTMAFSTSTIDDAISGCGDTYCDFDINITYWDQGTVTMSSLYIEYSLSGLDLGDEAIRAYVNNEETAQTEITTFNDSSSLTTINLTNDNTIYVNLTHETVMENGSLTVTGWYND